MPEPYRLPINCALTGENYVAQVGIGANSVPANLIIDTGSSATAVNAVTYDPDQDSAAVTSNLAQNLSYLSGNMLGAVVRTSLAAVSASFPGVNVAVNYATGASCFGAAQGILGLAYKPGNPAYTMQGNSWQNKYAARLFPAASDQLLDPLLDQVSAGGTLPRSFAIGVWRSLSSQATAALNGGTLVLGDGTPCIDLYQGPITYAKIIAANQYNTNLISVQVGSQPPIPVTAPPSWSNAASSSIIDSGSATLTLAQTLYNSILASFRAINPAFADALTNSAFGTNAGCDQTTLNLADWPALIFTLQGETAGTVTIAIAPNDYWQFDAIGKGQAVAAMCGDNGAMGGMSVLGLPLFAGNFVLFDRASVAEPGRIGFARLQ